MRTFGWIVPFAIPLLVVTGLTAQAPESTGTLHGCITDRAGQPLPGVSVDISADGVRRTVLSNRAGCYEFIDVPHGLYVVFAKLTGFTSFIREGLRITSNRVEQLDFQMRVACICECINYPTLASLWDPAEAVVRVRITGHQLGQDLGCGPYIRHTATIVTAWKRHSKITDRTITFLQAPMSGDAVPYAVGQDLILFLRWTSTQDAFESVNGSFSAFGIENGRILSSGFRSYAGMSADDFLAELRALSER
jgi:Carboxypeptidase regulatory-like domain